MRFMSTLTVGSSKIGNALAARRTSPARRKQTQRQQNKRTKRTNYRSEREHGTTERDNACKPWALAGAVADGVTVTHTVARRTRLAVYTREEGESRIEIAALSVTSPKGVMIDRGTTQIKLQ